MLKCRHIVGCMLVVAGTLGSVYAQDRPNPNQPNPNQPGQPNPNQPERDRNNQPDIKRETERREVRRSEEDRLNRGTILVPYSRAEGWPVVGNDDARLGKVADVVLSGNSGRVVYVLVSKGMENTYDRVTPIPFGALAWDNNRKVITLPVTEDQFKAAASFNLNDWKELNLPAFATTTYSYFKVGDDRMAEDRKVYRYNRTTTTTETKTEERIKKDDKKDDMKKDDRTGDRRNDGKEERRTEERKTEERRETRREGQPATDLKPDQPDMGTDRHPGHLVRVGEIWKKPLLAQDGKEQGIINDFIFDANSGRVAFLVITPNASLNAGEGQIAVPWPNFEVDKIGRLYALELNGETLRSAPRITADNWFETDNYVQDSYTRFGYDASVWNQPNTTTTTRTRTTSETTTRGDDRWRNKYRTAMTSGTPRTITGKVESIEQSTTKDGDMPVQIVTVKTDAGETIAVHTAPRTFYTENNLKLDKGDQVTIVGKEVQMDGKKCLCATEVTPANGKRVVFYPDQR